jgi:AcrR family transcriptional regulator
MSSKQERRSEETKKSILAAAQKLFAEQGYDIVTMREIAKEAGCSHTTIYIYYKDKITLLHQLSMPSLVSLKEQLETILLEKDSSEERIKASSLALIEFCLTNRNMYSIFFNVKASRVDVKEPDLEINKKRNELFDLLQRGLKECFEAELPKEQLLLFSRIYFYTLQGIVATYTYSEESVEALMERLSYTFNEAFEVLLHGFKQKNKN